MAKRPDIYIVKLSDSASQLFASSFVKEYLFTNSMLCVKFEEGLSFCKVTPIPKESGTSSLTDLFIPTRDILWVSVSKKKDAFGFVNE